MLIYTVATHVDEFDVSEVIENDNDGSYDDEADIGSAVDDDEGSNDCGVDIGSDDDDDGDDNDDVDNRGVNDAFNENEKH
jgi:hypothetical protein